MSAVYIASPLACAEEASNLAVELKSIGIEISSQWHDSGDTVDPDDARARAELLFDNLVDLAAADVVVVYIPRGRGRSTYCEAGYAIGLEIPVVWLVNDGSRSIFDAHELSSVVSSVDELPRAIERASLKWNAA